MGVRGIDELVAVLPPPAAEPVRAVAQGLSDLASLRHAALAPEDVLALGEVWERFAAQAASGRLGLLAAIDARDDVIPKAKVGDAGAVFASHALGQRRGAARRDAAWASLLRPDGGDLPGLGAAFAAGAISAAHVEVAVRAHRQLGPAVREALMDCQVPDGDDDITAALRSALAGLSDAFTAQVRLILVVDAVLAHYARSMSVPELEAIATRIVRTLNPPHPKHGHERRRLQLDQLPDGSWAGRFSCGADQGLRLQRAIAAWSAPRPGKGIDQDGVEFPIPDRRELGARQMDALTDIVNVALAKTGITLPEGPGTPASSATPTSSRGSSDSGDADPRNAPNVPDAGGARDAGDADQPEKDLQEPPPGEGPTVVLREPGALVAPYPSADLVLVAGIDHVAAAWAYRREDRPDHQQESFASWLRGRYTPRLRPADERPAGGREPPGQTQPAGGLPRAGGQGIRDCDSGRQRPERQRPERQRPERQRQGKRKGESDDSGLEWLRRALSPYATPARLEHAGAVDASTLELLACNATIRAALLAPTGALLDLGRSQRLASAPQKTALLARDGGCVIPGCTVPGDACDAHHVQWWERGGATDLDNLALVCGRHHTEIHLQMWEIEMHDGIPWVRPPRWMDRGRGLLRNAVHHPEDQGRRAA